MFEDDWECNTPFSIEPYVSFLAQSGYDQVVFNDRTDGTVYPQISAIDNKPIKQYIYNPHHKDRDDVLPSIKEAYKRFEKEMGYDQIKPGNGYHYPGFSLNPSVFDTTKIKHFSVTFNESSEFNDTFELYFAFRCLKKGFKVCFTHLSIIHIGNYNSAYVLNDKERVYDKYDKNLKKKLEASSINSTALETSDTSSSTPSG
jgi:hypothetical protein